MENFFEYLDFKKQCEASNSEPEILKKREFIENYVDEILSKYAVNETTVVVSIQYLYDLGKEIFWVFPYFITKYMIGSDKYSVNRACSNFPKNRNVKINDVPTTHVFLVFTKK